MPASPERRAPAAMLAYVQVLCAMTVLLTAAAGMAFAVSRLASGLSL